MADPNTFCHYGWEGTGAYAFWRYATAYYDSAEILFEKFVASAGHNDILDGTGMTMCFLYRHFLELSLKHLYVKFAHPTKDEYKKFLENGHRLISLWNATKPVLSKLRKRAGSTVSIGVLEHYVEEFDKFDPDAMAMRYPVKNDLSRMHESTRLDILNLHERVNELYWAIVGIANDLEGQMEDEVNQEKIDAFLAKYEDLRPRVLALLDELRPFEAKEPNELGWPISHVRAVLKRISLEELTALMNEPCNANCVDVDNTRRLQDSEVKDFIAEQCGAKSVVEFQRLSPEEQMRIVLDAKAEGASIRQVMSHTGWSYRRVREAGDEVTVKS